MQILNETLGAWKLSPWRRTPGSRLREAAASPSGLRYNRLFSLFLFKTERRGNSPRTPTWVCGFPPGQPTQGQPGCAWEPGPLSTLPLPALPSPHCLCPSRVFPSTWRLAPRPGTQTVPSPCRRRFPRSRASTEVRGHPHPASPPPLSAGSQPHRPALLQLLLAAPPDDDSQQSPAAGHH